MSALKPRSIRPQFPLRPKQVLRPTTEQELRDILRPENRLPLPIRPVGANTSTTGCTAADGGTVIDLTGLSEILSIDREQVTVQAGVSLRQLADVLDENGLELPGYYDFCDRTIGGAVCGGCIGPSMPEDGAQLSSQVLGLKLITPEGETLVRARTMNASASCRDDQVELPSHRLRSSYGAPGAFAACSVPQAALRGSARAARGPGERRVRHEDVRYSCPQPHL
jgi:FAD/FMN-containing dehydrogenase